MPQQISRIVGQILSSPAREYPDFDTAQRKDQAMKNRLFRWLLGLPDTSPIVHDDLSQELQGKSDEFILLLEKTTLKIMALRHKPRHEKPDAGEKALGHIFLP